MSNDQNRRQVWSAGGGLVIVIYLGFLICHLEVLLTPDSKTAGHLYRQSRSPLTWLTGPGFLGLDKGGSL
jgi:hypothetical protein